MPNRLDFWAKPLAQAVNAFFYPLKPAHYLELVTPLWNYAQLKARVEGIHQETSDTFTLLLRPGRGFRAHKAGQYIHLGVCIDGKRHIRPYSISSPPERNDGLITITCKAIMGGKVSQYLAHQMKPGLYVSISQPEGNFVKLSPMPESVVYITAGSGITPVMAMLRSLSEAKAQQNIVHIHYAKHKDEVIFSQELTSLSTKLPNYKYIFVFTRDNFSNRLPATKFSADQLTRMCPDWPSRTAYACGPSSLLDEIEELWPQKSTAPLFIERFQAKKGPQPPDTIGGKVSFSKSQIAALADGESPLLKVAEAQGLSPPHGCRMGICHSCDTTLKSGTVRDLRTGEVISCSDNIKVQLCVCAAAGNIDLDL